MVKMLIMDLDNTLLRTDKTISAYTVSVLEECRRRGITTAFCTARSAQAAARMVSVFTPEVFIGYGGALALAGEKVISRIDIPADLSFELIGELLRAPEIKRIHAVNETVALTDALVPNDTETAHYTYCDFSKRNGQSYLKISVVAENPEAVERIASRYPMLDLLRYSGEDLYRLARRDAVKWNAIKTVAEFFGLDARELAAFGDDVNDLEMLENCGTGVAVANAIDAAKAAADFVCGSSDDDGVARWIEENLL